MRVFYNSTTTNFGDYINAWLWPRLVPDLLEVTDDNVLVGIGSLLKADLNRVPGKKVIFGTGSGYGNPPTAKATENWKVYATRGPLTNRLFGLDPSLAITDGAWLISQLPEYQTLPEKTDDVVFIPHFTSAKFGNWEPVTEAAGLKYIDPLDDGPSILRRIAQAKLAVVESLHGAIFADYFRTPWVATSSATRVLHFKWVDWCMSLDMDYRSTALPPSDLVDFLIQKRRPSLVPPVPRVEHFNADMFHYRHVDKAVSATASYRMKTRLKAIARRQKNAALDQLRTYRDGPLMRGWNKKYTPLVAEYLAGLAQQEGSLSSDAIRETRIQQLAEAFDQFKRDYQL